MQKIEEIYRARLKLLIDEAGSQAKLSEKTGKAPAQISQWLNASKDSKTRKPRVMDRNTARELERACDKPEGWMDQPIAREPANAPAGAPTGAVYRAPSHEEMEFLEKHWRLLLNKDREKYTREIAKLAKVRQAEREELFAEAGVTAIARKAALDSRARTASTVEVTGRLKQRQLLEDLEEKTVSLDTPDAPKFRRGKPRKQ